MYTLRRPHSIHCVAVILALAAPFFSCRSQATAQQTASPTVSYLSASLFDPARPVEPVSPTEPAFPGDDSLYWGSADVLATSFLRLPPAMPDGQPQVGGTASGEAPLDPWGQPARKPRKVSNTAEGVWGTVTSQVTMQDRETTWEEPLWKRQWKSEEAWRVRMAGPVFLFGKVGANGDEVTPQNMQVAGHTGVACNVPVGSDAEFQVRSGPRLTYTDPLRPDRTCQTDWLLEVQAHCPLLFGIGLEYQGTAMPALSPLQRDAINQDLHLAIPVGEVGKVQVGAKHNWQSTTVPQSWSDGMQLYFGLQLTR